RTPRQHADLVAARMQLAHPAGVAVFLPDIREQAALGIKRRDQIIAMQGVAGRMSRLAGKPKSDQTEFGGKRLHEWLPVSVWTARISAHRPGYSHAAAFRGRYQPPPQAPGLSGPDWGPRT